jgi:hypothetical protein
MLNLLSLLAHENGLKLIFGTKYSYKKSGVNHVNKKPIIKIEEELAISRSSIQVIRFLRNDISIKNFDQTTLTFPPQIIIS